MLNVEVKKIKQFQKDILTYFEEKHADICNEIETNQVLTDELVKAILDAANQYKSM